MIHENQGFLCPASHWLGYDHLALPLGIEKLPIGFEIQWIHQRGVVVKIIKGSAGKRKNILVLVVSVDVFSLPPLGLIKNCRKDQRGLDRIQKAGFEESGLSRANSADKDVGEKFSC